MMDSENKSRQATKLARIFEVRDLSVCSRNATWSSDISNHTDPEPNVALVRAIQEQTKSAAFRAYDTRTIFHRRAVTMEVVRRVAPATAPEHARRKTQRPR